MANGLVAPKNLVINFRPSPRQYELWRLLQPDYCPHCGGHIIQKISGTDHLGHPIYEATCDQCGSTNLPHVILAGGAAGGGKSFIGSCWVISSCIRFPDLKAVVARKTIKSLMGSTYITILKVLKMWGLEENVHYKMNGLKGIMTFWNDSTITFTELELLPRDQEYERLGSNEWSIGFIDEVSEICEKGVEVLASRLRWNVASTFKTQRLLLSTNPCTTWVRSRFVQDDDGNPAMLASGDFYAPFSVFDNPDKDFVATYRANLEHIKDEATRQRLLWGNWDFVDTNIAAAYWKFNGSVHLVDGLKEKSYDPLKPIILSFDFNMAPFMSCLAVQIDYELKKIYILEEILGRPENKENNTPKFAKKIRTKYLNEQHTGGLLVTGDPAGLARSTQTESGVNNYTIIMSNLSSPILRPQKKLLKKQPSQVTRLEFVNSLFEGYGGWQIQIDMRCRRFTEDLIYQKKNADGTKSKAKVTDPKLGIKYEKYGHLSDCFDYLLCLFVNQSWRDFQSKNTGIETTVTPIYGGFEY